MDQAALIMSPKSRS